MSPTSFDDLDRDARRHAVVHSTLRICASVALLIALYVVLPVPSRHGVGAVLAIIGGLLLFLVLLAFQVRSILKAEHPELRAAEALAVAIPLVIIVFAFAYLSMWESNHASFTEPLDRVGALYFTVTVASTVGFGDIAARTDPARLLVTFQIVLDILLIVGVARALMLAARVGVQRRHGDSPRHRGEHGDHGS